MQHPPRNSYSCSFRYSRASHTSFIRCWLDSCACEKDIQEKEVGLTKPRMFENAPLTAKVNGVFWLYDMKGGIYHQIR